MFVKERDQHNDLAFVLRFRICINFIIGYPAEVGALFTTVSSVRVSRVSVMVSVKDSVK